MTRVLDSVMEQRAEKQRSQLVIAIYGGLSSSIERAGGELQRLSVRMLQDDTLLTMVARFPAGYMVCHVGSDDLAGCFVRALREAKRESLTWKADKYRQNGG